MATSECDVAVIGGGIVGLATAKALVEAGCRRLIVLEAEGELAAHQTGNNSGVIHSGLYYKPGSLKARNCAAGREWMYQFCAEHGLPHERCGKIVIACDPTELPALDELERRGRANGLSGMRRITPDAARELEPHVACIAALHVPETGIANYRAVSRKYAELVEQGGASVQTSRRVIGFRRLADGITLETTTNPVQCRNVVNCGGLWSDRVARLCGVDPGLQIIPFRGEYYELRPERHALVKNLIYPVPDPRFPFLGVHFTRMVGGGVECGPNAVLALARAGYSWRRIAPRDLLQLGTYSGFWRMAAKYWRMGCGEMHRSLSKSAFLRGLQRLIPEIQAADIVPAGAGVRAQAVEPSGALVDDFRIIEAEHQIHVLNAPSPAATASLSIGKHIADLAMKNFRLA
ncbi:MAG: L-2-hydroxyglutarate oxidase [Planctomycetia bacterium]|nr:L-2-hydroxyglutarate oxidase [Planctomycetia bacterium]